MSDNQVLRAWEERVVSQEKGSRIVHYIMRDSIGSSLLAVVGRDRCINHMSYVVSDDYLRVFGSTSTVHTGTNWGARRDVVEWLVSVVSRGGPILANSTNPSTFKPQITGQNNKRRSSPEETEGPDPKEPAMQASKRIKSCIFDQTLESSRADLTSLVSENRRVSKWRPTHKRLKIKLSSNRPAQVSSKFGRNIELLSQDSGLQGCWFRCKILCSSQNLLKVQYENVLDVNGLGKLEEWVPASRVAAPDKLGMRSVGRLTIRPCPREGSSDITFVAGAAVDVWWCNGWWEGVVIGYETPAERNLQVYFPGENRFLTVKRKNIRISRDWIDGKWVSIKAKPDILSFLSSIFSSGPKLPPLPILADTTTSAPGYRKMLKAEQLEGSEDDKVQIPISSTPEAVEELNLKKRFISKYNEEISRTSG